MKRNSITSRKRNAYIHKSKQLVQARSTKLKPEQIIHESRDIHTFSLDKSQESYANYINILFTILLMRWMTCCPISTILKFVKKCTRGTFIFDKLDFK